MTDLIAAAQHAGASLFRIDAGIGRDLVGLDWNRDGASAGCILFSHGAASAPWEYASMIDDWRARGYRVLAPLHVDSTDHPDTLAYPGLASWRARLEDMRSLAQLTDQPHIAAGHSYGALVALTLGGARGEEPADIARSCGDATPSRHTRCVLAFSPPPAIPGLISEAGYARLARPALIQTGTRDDMPGWHDPHVGWELHRQAWDASPAKGYTHLLVLDGVDHTFGGAICEPGPENGWQSAELAIALETAALFLNGEHLTVSPPHRIETK